MKIFTFSFKSLLVAAGLMLGSANAWGEVTPFSESYSSTSTTTGWSTSVGGRFDPAILNESDNYFLSVTQANRKNNGATVTGTIISKKAAAGDDFTITFDMRLSSSNDQTNTEFQIRDASNSGNIISLKETGSWATTWTLNGTSTQVTLPNSNKAGSSNTIADVTWCSYKITRSGDKTFLTITNKETSAVIFERTAITGSSATGGLGNIVFISSRNYANFAIDNIVVREVEEGDVPDVTYYEITTKYQLSDETQVKADRVEPAAEGESYSPVYDATFDDEDYRYTYVSGANTIASVSEDATITIIYSREALAEHTVNFNTTGDLTRTLSSVTVKDAKSYTYAYPRYIADGTSLYQIDKARYDLGFQNTASNVTSDVNRTEAYSSISGTVAFFSEAEDIATLTKSSTNNNIPARCSGGNAAYAAEDAVITTLTPGKYTITAAVFGNAGTDFVFKNGEKVLYTLTTAGYELEGTSEELTFSEETTITLAAVGNGGTSPKVIDYILIKKTAEPVTVTAAGYATFSSEYALNLASLPDGLSAYYVASDGVGADYVKLTTASGAVEANTGLLFQGTAGATYYVPVAASGSPLSGNKLIATDGNDVAKGNYVFAFVDEHPTTTAGFYPLGAATHIDAGKAYLNTGVLSKVLRIGDGEASEVVAPEVVETEEPEILFNMAGVQVDKNFKGFVVNQKGEKRFNR